MKHVEKALGQYDCRIAASELADFQEQERGYSVVGGRVRTRYKLQVRLDASRGAQRLAQQFGFSQ